MGASGAPRGKPEDTVIREDEVRVREAEWERITPYRMACLMEIAGKATKQITSGVWHLTFEEMEVILDMIAEGIVRSREQNERKEEERHVY